MDIYVILENNIDTPGLICKAGNLDNQDTVDSNYLRRDKCM